MATRAILLPGSAEFPSTNFAPYSTIHTTARRPVLLFDAATSEKAYWTFVAPVGWTGTITAVAKYSMTSAVTGGVALDVAVEAITTGDATDLDAVESFDAVNTGTDSAVPGTAGHQEDLSVTLTNADTAAAGDQIRVSVARNVAHATDTATGDLQLHSVEIRDAA